VGIQNSGAQVGQDPANYIQDVNDALVLAVLCAQMDRSVREQLHRQVAFDQVECCNWALDRKK
jgi:hypothetical protein